ncbi:hypothetical protein ABTY00_27595, partial [Streptomyces microflavus]|uniref:hypothetical protein n=1 Tax=Streptomyces microflavus TaxID=1919 RepID=UPI00332F2B05
LRAPVPRSVHRGRPAHRDRHQQHDGEARKWADADPYFSRAYQAVVRYVPERATTLFALLETGRYSVAGASIEIGISEGVVHARIKRDKVFAARLRQAQECGRGAREARSACTVSKP